MIEQLLLDTNAVIALFNGVSQVVDRLAEVKLHLPTVVLGELYFGAYKSGRVEANLARLNKFIGRVILLVCDAETAVYYGQAKQQLQAKGRPIPDNDVWIAAIALQHNLTLISRDRHFQEIDNLSVEAWE